MHFREWKLLYSNSNFTEICSYGFNYQYANIGSDNGLSPSRWQAIIWTNDSLVYWCIYVSLSFNELNNAKLRRNKHRRIKDVYTCDYIFFAFCLKSNLCNPYKIWISMLKSDSWYHELTWTHAINPADLWFFFSNEISSCLHFLCNSSTMKHASQLKPF